MDIQKELYIIFDPRDSESETDKFYFSLIEPDTKTSVDGMNNFLKNRCVLIESTFRKENEKETIEIRYRPVIVIIKPKVFIKPIGVIVRCNSHDTDDRLKFEISAASLDGEFHQKPVLVNFFHSVVVNNVTFTNMTREYFKIPLELRDIIDSHSSVIGRLTTKILGLFRDPSI